jgi:hypothetical protein
MAIVLPAGAKPWLLDGDPGQIGGIQYIEAYLPPSSATDSLRRGSVVTLRRGAFPAGQAWTQMRSENYAQVVITGRFFEEIRSDLDLNRPFRVLGSFDDTELIRIVNFLRSGPPAPLPGGGSTRVELRPILYMQRQSPTTLSVRLRRAIMSGQSIILEKQGENWMVSKVSNWIA